VGKEGMGGKGAGGVQEVGKEVLDVLVTCQSKCGLQSSIVQSLGTLIYA